MQIMHRRLAHGCEDDKCSDHGVPHQQQPLLRRRKPFFTRHAYWEYQASMLFKKSLIFTASTLLIILMFKACYSVLPTSLVAKFSRGAPREDGNQQDHEKKANHKGATVEELDILPWNPIYRVPEAMPQVGDRSDHYAQLRMDTDAYLDDPIRYQRHLTEVLASRHTNIQARPMEVHNSDQMLYDIYDCPDTPPPGYPYAWKTIDILKAWPIDQLHPPTSEDGNGTALIHHSFCIFDYQKDYAKAITYRDASVPFVVVNDPAVLKTATRWALPHYMESLLGTVPHRAEYSVNNHFMYYIPPPKNSKIRGKQRGLTVPEGWTEPTKQMRMTYQAWLNHANVSESQSTPHDPHWYYRLIGCGAMGNDGSCDYGSSEYLFDELPFFQPKQPSLYLVDVNEQKGIHCRFGMRGVIAENHFDGSRNAIALLSGTRRYILSHPDQCENLALYPKGHPSARHSAVDWANPDLEKFPEFGTKARSNEVVLQAGQVLYLPTNWFHYIVSLELNFQCNTRSGIEQHLMHYVQNCGF